MEILIAYLPEWALPYLYRFKPSEWVIVGQVLAVLLMLGGAALAVYSFFRARGYRRYQGRWVSPTEFQMIVQELYDGVKKGRVPDYETMQILDEYVYGRTGSQIRKLTKADHI